MEVSFKGTYQMNGVKKIDRLISCTADEARTYTQFMTNKKLQEEWIKPIIQEHKLKKDSP